MKFFENEELLEVAKILNKMAIIYSELGQKQKALEIHEKIYGIKKWFYYHFGINDKFQNFKKWD